MNSVWAMLTFSPPENVSITPPTRLEGKIKHLTAFHPSHSWTPKCGRMFASFGLVPRADSHPRKTIMQNANSIWIQFVIRKDYQLQCHDYRIRSSLVAGPRSDANNHEKQKTERFSYRLNIHQPFSPPPSFHETIPNPEVIFSNRKWTPRVMLTLSPPESFNKTPPTREKKKNQALDRIPPLPFQNS